LIKTLSSESNLDEEQLATLSRNKEHLVIMLGKDWFSGALSAVQKKDFEDAAK